MTDRKRLRNLRLDKISGVDRPAQEPATVATIIKRHTKNSDPATSPDGEQPEPQNQGEQDMTEEEKAALEAELAKSRADLEAAKAFGALSDVEKAFYADLSDTEKETFLSKSADERSAEVASATEADAVVYKSLDGAEFRKSDDARVIAAVKRADDAVRKAEKIEAEAGEKVLAKRAADELGNCPGDVSVKSSLLKAIDGIADDTVRKGALALLKAGNDALTGAFEENGTSESGADTPAEQLESLAKRFATEQKVSIQKARMAVLETPEGSALYEASLA